jgi:acetyl-CoA synthetase
MTNPIPVSPLDRVRDLLAVYDDPRASVAALVCDDHPAGQVAYTVVQPGLTSVPLTYGQLREASERFAAALAGLGIGAGDRVATLMGKSADYLTALLGIWRAGAVHVPLFTAFAPPAIAMRLTGSGAKAVICDQSQRAKLDPGGDIPAAAPWRIIVAGPATDQAPAGRRDLGFAGLLSRHEPGMPAAALGGEAPIVHIYTSGTTGRPKAVVVPARALASFRAYLEFACDLRPDDVYWNAADPGWAYGLYFGVLGAMSMGVPGVLLQAGFSPELTMNVLSRYQVTSFGAAPTVYRALRAAGVRAAGRLRLRCASSAGEPLTPEVSEWATRVLGVPVHDHYGQTETAMLVNNHHHPALRRPVKPGSMGQPMPGWAVRVLAPDRDEIAPAGARGRIAVDTSASPLNWFHGYHDDPAASAAKFSSDGRWYLTGDTGAADSDGDFHFSARDDDVIIMAGYRIGPFDVESVLASHPDVTECAAIAVPDQIRGEVLEAYVVPRDPAAATAALAAGLQQLVKDKFAAHAYPRAVHFVSSLPKTPSGKIQRYLLRQQRRQELGCDQPAGQLPGTADRRQ